jgi:hypothetical protein
VGLKNLINLLHENLNSSVSRFWNFSIYVTDDGPLFSGNKLILLFRELKRNQFMQSPPIDQRSVQTADSTYKRLVLDEKY